MSAPCPGEPSFPWIKGLALPISGSNHSADGRSRSFCPQPFEPTSLPDSRARNSQPLRQRGTNRVDKRLIGWHSVGQGAGGNQGREENDGNEIVLPLDVRPDLDRDRWFAL